MFPNTYFAATYYAGIYFPPTSDGPIFVEITKPGSITTTRLRRVFTTSRLTAVLTTFRRR